MRCCLLSEDGYVTPLPAEDGSEQYYMDPIVMPIKKPGSPTLYINPSDVMFERYPVDQLGDRSSKSLGFVYAKRAPNPAQLDEARRCLEGWHEIF